MRPPAFSARGACAIEVKSFAGRILNEEFQIDLSVIQIDLSIVEMTLSIVEMTLSIVEVTLSIVEVTLSIVEIALSAAKMFPEWSVAGRGLLEPCLS